MPSGLFVSAVSLFDTQVHHEQHYNAGVERQDSTQRKPLGVLVHDSVAPGGHPGRGSARRQGGYETSYNPNPVTRGNARAPSFYDVFYERIHYDPAVMRLGQLLNEQTRELTIWNAYFEARTLLSVGAVDADGLDLQTGTNPQLFKPLQQKIFPLTVSIEGPPVINATYTFTWDNQVNTWHVSGQRIVVFAYPPDPSADFIERLHLYYTINQAYSGKEQRMSLNEHPKISYSYRSQVLDHELQMFDSMMWGWQSRSFAVPIWNSYTYTSQAIPAEATILYVESTADREFTPNTVALIFAAPDMFEAVEIQEVLADRLLLKRPTQRTWTRKVPVFPVRTMRMAREISYTGPVANFREIEISFTGEVGEALREYVWPHMYKGLPVLEFSPDMSAGLSGSYTRNMDWEDGQYSQPLIVDRSDLGTPKQTWQFAWDNYFEIQQFKSLICQLYGSTREFWISTWTPDLTIAAPIELDSSALYVVDSAQVNMYHNRKGRENLVITLRDGTVLYRGITSVTPGSSVVPNSELFMLDEPIPRRILPSQVKCISYLTVSRFENEAFEFVWKSQEFATMSAMIKGLTDGI